MFPAAVRPDISRLPDKKRMDMPGSQTSQGQDRTRNIVLPRITFRRRKGVDILNRAFAAQWLGGFNFEAQHRYLTL
jgi:hypothetical protein